MSARAYRLALVAFALAACAACGAPREPAFEQGLSVGEALGGDRLEGYARALEPREIVFPQDHGPHPSFRTEWWYWTGNLADEAGRRYGFQLTFFRVALDPDPPPRSSPLAASQLWLAHFALGDEAAGTFTARERFSRGALGLAGAEADPFRVWLEDWEAVALEADAAFPMRLDVETDALGLELVLRDLKGPVFQGDRGLSQKGPEPGDASYYYTYPRLEARGVLRRGDERLEVEGQAWLDREWSTSVLSDEQIGWDWFALQLEDGRELMFYQLRRRDGDRDPFNKGLVVSPEGETRVLRSEELSFEPLAFWESPTSGARYPVAWRVRVAGEDLTLETRPLLEASELPVSVRYWEGAIEVRGEGPGGEVRGRGFLEMTGYDEQSRGLAR